MSDEIKRILDGLREDYEGIGTYYYPEDVLEPKDPKILYDYIIELQEKINTYENPEDLTLMFMYCNEKTKDKIKEFQQENKELHNKIDKAIELNKQVIKDTKDFYRPTSDTIYSGDTLIDIAEQNLEILKDSDVDE